MNPIAARYGEDDYEAPIASNDTVTTLLRHASCREFADTPISDSMRQTLYAAAQSAPSKSNLQQYSFIDVIDTAHKQQLQQLFPKLDWAFKAPMLAFVLGDLSRNQKISALHDHVYNAHPEDAFLNAAVDAALATQALITAAESLGLGTCPLSQIRERLDEIALLLSLPTHVFPICAVAIGYPMHEQSQVVSPRLPARMVVHTDRYQPPNPADIHAYDQRFTKAVGAPKPRYPEYFGEPTTATWSNNVARQTAVAERSQFRSFLRAQQILD